MRRVDAAPLVLVRREALPAAALVALSALLPLPLLLLLGSTRLLLPMVGRADLAGRGWAELGRVAKAAAAAFMTSRRFASTQDLLGAGSRWPCGGGDGGDAGCDGLAGGGAAAGVVATSDVPDGNDCCGGAATRAERCDAAWLSSGTKTE